MRNLELPQQRSGQAKTMMICEGPDTVPAEVGQWYSPEAVAELIAAEREACSKVRAGKPRELPSVGTGALLGEQQFCFERGWKEGAAAVRRNIAKRSNAELTGATPAGGASALTQMLGME